MAIENLLQKSFRVHPDLWTAATNRAAESDQRVSDVLRAALTEYLKDDCDSCESCTICGGDVLQLETLADAPTATIMGFGRFSETSNPDIQALIDRAKELLAEGAVGVSVATDLNPADLPSNPEDVTEDDIMNAGQRNRHVAIVDTPAFSGAFLDLAADGTVSGPLVFEGEITGDVRAIGPVGTMNLEDPTTLPMPIIFDMMEGDHTGPVIGFIDRLERVEGTVGAGTAPVAASTSAYPAYLFAEPEPTPMTVSAPDAQGFRRYSGIIAPTGVCHKGRGGCYTYKGADLGYFHSGARVPLDDGTFTRVGPLMFGGLHADDQELDYAQALTRTNEDARTVFSMGRMFHHPKGLLYSGPLFDDADIMRVQACAPSIEAWPDHRGKLELKTALMVPRPALPVAASLTGGGVQLAENSAPVVEESHGDFHTRLEAFSERLERLEATTAELLSAHMVAQLTEEEMKTAYLVVGVPGSGKSWVCEQLTDLYEYVPHDDFINTSYTYGIQERAKTASKPLLIETPFSMSRVVDPLVKLGFDVTPVFIGESETVLRERYQEREGKPIVEGHITRQGTYLQRARESGAFHGTSAEVLDYLRQLAQ